MRKEINEQLTICAMQAAKEYLVSSNGYQLPTIYPKMAGMGPMIVRSGLAPAVSNYEEDRPDSRDKYEEKYNANQKSKCRVNDAVYATLKSFVECEGVKDLWAPDETLTAKIKAVEANNAQAKNKLLLVVSRLTNVGEYILVREYVLQAIALLKLALNTFPEGNDSKKDTKGADQ